MAKEYFLRSEIASAQEFIQYLEELASGSLVSGAGVNRPLERLAENTDALLDALQSARLGSHASGGGTISWNSGSGVLSWTTDIVLHMLNEAAGGVQNTLQASASPITLSTSGAVAYALLDRASSANLTVQTAASASAFLAAVTAAADARLDVCLLARRVGTDVFFLGHQILTGGSLTNSFGTDAQYGQQSEVTLVRTAARENLDLMLTGGGTLTWDETSGDFSWDADLRIEFPMSAGYNRLVPNTVTLPANTALYVTLVRSPGAAQLVSPVLATLGSVPTSTDSLVLAIRRADGKLYLRNGQTLSDGDSVSLGAHAPGVQWAFGGAATGVQITDLTEGGAYPNRTYGVGSKDLLVFRAGLKKKASLAYWLGTYPSGSLQGSLVTSDDYVEEDPGDGHGTRILWLADGQAASEPLYFPPATHSPALTWPTSPEWLEALIGVQGEGPSPVESLGIYPEPGGGSPKDGLVKLKAGTNVTLSYDSPNNAIVISMSPALTSLTVSGGSLGAQAGALTLLGSTLVTLVEVAPGQIGFTIATDQAAALTGAHSPSAANPYVTSQGDVPLEGFDIVWTTGASPRKLMTAGGVLRHAGIPYRSDNKTGNTGRVEISATDVFPAQTLTAGAWVYAYLYPNTIAGRKPLGRISTSPPDFSAGAAGVHPLNSQYKFLTSLKMTGLNALPCFRKAGAWVFCSGIDLTTAFSALAGSVSYQAVDLTSLLPATGVLEVRLKILLYKSGVIPAGTFAALKIRGIDFAEQTGYQAIFDTATGLAEFIVEVPLFGGAFELQSNDFDSISDVRLLGYAEGRTSASANIAS